LLVRDNKYNVSDHLLDITEQRFAQLFDNSDDNAIQAIYLCFDMSIQRQWEKIPDTFLIPTILFTRLDIDMEQVIKYNYARKEIAAMKQIINENDALYNSMMWNFERVKYDAMLRKNDQQNGMLRLRYMVTGWEDIQDLCDEICSFLRPRAKRIFLICHGQTDKNAQGIRQGHEIDSVLNHTGIEQAKLTAKYLAKHIAMHHAKHAHARQTIWTSPQKRAMETARIISEQIQVRYKKVKRLREAGMGKLSGLTHDAELQREVQRAEQKWASVHRDPIDRNNLDTHNGFGRFMEKELKRFDLGVEPHDQLDHRVGQIKRMIERSDCQTIYIVSHNGLLGLLVQKLLGVVEYPRGIMNGENCWVGLIGLDHTGYRMMCAPNTEHLDTTVSE
jgi:probable phosphoglycerate mutase